MKYCKNCNTYHDNAHSSCIVCGRQLVKKDREVIVAKQGYPLVMKVRKKRHLAAKILGMISIGISLILATINALTYTQNPTPWSLIIIGAISYAWILLLQVILSKHNYTTKVNRQVFIVSIFIIAIDIFSGYTGWALTYVIPFILSGTTILIPIIVASKPEKYFLHVRSLLLLIIFNLFVSIIPYISNWMIADITWTAAICGVSGILLFLSMWLFAAKTTMSELVKIFRF